MAKHRDRPSKYLSMFAVVLGRAQRKPLHQIGEEHDASTSQAYAYAEEAVREGLLDKEHQLTELGRQEVALYRASPETYKLPWVRGS